MFIVFISCDRSICISGRLVVVSYMFKGEGGGRDLLKSPFFNTSDDTFVYAFLFRQKVVNCFVKLANFFFSRFISSHNMEFQNFWENI